jgi:hypothetical protein
MTSSPRLIEDSAIQDRVSGNVAARENRTPELRRNLIITEKDQFGAVHKGFAATVQNLLNHLALVGPGNALYMRTKKPTPKLREKLCRSSSGGERGGPWLKIKNPIAPAAHREALEDWNK